MARNGEEIYETSGINDDKCSLVDEGYWYENDLLLAAELGKTLLERNRDLESQLSVQTKNTNNLRMEIDLLKKQLDTLRELNRNKMILYEDVDRNSHDLEMTNRTLTLENKKVRDRINNLVKKNKYLEQQVDDYQERLSSSEQVVEDLRKVLDSQSLKDPWETEIILQKTQDRGSTEETARRLKCPQCKELKERISVLYADLEMKGEENDDLHDRNSNLLRKLRLAEVELEDVKSCHPQDAKRKSQPDTLIDDLYSTLEYDIDRVDEKPIEVGNLDTGGKVFTSSTSLKSIGAETTRHNEPSSLLKELDEKYNNLVKQYESLLQSSQPQLEPHRLCEHCSSITVVDDCFQKKLDNIFSEETRRQRKSLTTQNYRPKYKELFRDAFSLLKDMKQSRRPEDPKERPCLIALGHLSQGVEGAPGH